MCGARCCWLVVTLPLTVSYCSLVFGIGGRLALLLSHTQRASGLSAAAELAARATLKRELAALAERQAAELQALAAEHSAVMARALVRTRTALRAGDRSAVDELRAGLPRGFVRLPKRASAPCSAETKCADMHTCYCVAFSVWILWFAGCFSRYLAVAD